jgi:hypothetical protein
MLTLIPALAIRLKMYIQNKQKPKMRKKLNRTDNKIHNLLPANSTDYQISIKSFSCRYLYL